MSSIKIILITICLLFNQTTTLNLIPDPQNPLLMKNPTNFTGGQSIIFRFMFPTGSNGLNYAQYIGITFPIAASADLQFNDIISTIPRWTCALTDGIYTIEIIAEKGRASPGLSTLTAEANVAYCKITDKTRSPLKAGVNYRLTITLGSTVKFAGSYFQRLIGLFTATANNPERVIIDSLPTFGTLGYYSDWTAYFPKPLEIVSANTLVRSGPNAATGTGDIYPYNTFDIIVNVKVNSFISIADVYITFKYPTSTVSGAVAVSTNKISDSSPSGQALTGVLTLTSFSTDSVIVNGIAENLTPGRTFQIGLIGWKALDTPTTANLNLEMIVYYKNTYSIYSYSANPIFSISKASLSPVEIKHPEGWDIWRNGAWPLRFTFTPNTELTNGGYVLIQHSDAKDGSKKLSFIPSSCDFSENIDTSFDNSFGKRPNCYPLRLDHNYPNASSTNEYKGSGFFFYAKKFNNKAFFVTIWAFADNCGGTINNDNNYTGANSATVTYKGASSPYDPINNLTKVSVTFNFIITIYKGINVNAKNEDRLTTQIAIAQSSATTMTGKCYNNLIQGTPIISQALKFDSNTLLAGIIDNTATGADLMLFKEINDWQISSQVSSTTCTAACWGTDITGTFTEAYIYSSTSAISTSSYFLIKFNVQINSADKMINYLALPTKSGNQLLGGGKYQWIFSKQWFVAGDSLTVSSGTACYLSWAYTDNAFNSNNKQNKLIYNDVKTLNQTTDYNNSTPANKYYGNNFITTTGKTKSTIDAALSQITSTQLKIVSTSANGQVSQSADVSDFSFWDFIATTTGATQATVGLFTSCIKWISPLPTVKSLYSYIDIQWQFMNTGLINNSFLVTKNNRFIKLFPEGGVFQDITKGTSNLNFASNNRSPYIVHFAFGKDAITNGVCLIELDGPTISQMSDGLTNSFVIWIYYGVLIETDYSDAAATYPVAPLSSTVSAYGLQSGPAQSTENQYVNFSSDGTTGWKNIGVENLIGQITSSTNNGGSFIGDMRSHYHFTMGSVLILNGIAGKNITSSTATAATQPSLLIPIYCPLQSDTSKVYKGYVTSGVSSVYNLPTVMAAWVSLTSHAIIGTLTKPIGQSANGRKYSVLVSDTLRANTNGGISSIVYNDPQYATLRFKQYTITISTDTAADNTLYILNAIQKDMVTAPNSVTCTGHALFIHSTIGTDTAISFNPFIGANNRSYNGAKIFYILGKTFHKAVFTGIGGIAGYTYNISDNMTGSRITDSAGVLAYTGVQRPTVDFFVNLNTLDKLGYFCTPYQNIAAKSLQNYVIDSGVNNFITDWNPAASANWGLTTITADKLEVMYKADTAGNTKLILNPPINIPTGSNILISATGAFTSNTICGLVTTAGGIVKECDNNNQIITCVPTANSASLTVCCYNISITDTFQLSGLSVKFPNPSITGISGYISQDMYMANTSSMNWITNSSLSTDVLNTTSSKITAVSYTNVNQDSGIGKAIFTISLAREAVRDMKITLSGDYSLMLVQGNPPRCIATFSVGNTATSYGKSWDNGDFMIDTCSTNGLANNLSSIIITTKKMVYKCGLAFSKTLYVILWPVVTVNWSIPPQSTNIYKITTILNDGTTKVSLNTPTFNLTTNLQQIDKPSVVSQWDILCSVSSIYPRIPGEYADYQFDFDLDINKKVIENVLPNEVTIFFPYQYYGSITNNILCYYNASLTGCSFTDEGILNIRFSKALPIGSGKKISVIVAGIINPSIEGDYSFPCTVNQTNFSTGERRNIMTGSGKLTGGITITAGSAFMGSLRFETPPNRVSDNNPRALSVHTFRVSPDTAIGQTNILATISTDPIFIFTFPDEYRLGWFTSKATATIDEYINDTSNNIKINTTLSSLTTSQFGNRITIKLGLSYTLPTNFRYWDIKIGNVNGPLETTVITTTKTSLGTTGSFKATLTNSNYSSLYRTYTNLNTYTSDSLATAVDSWLGYYRGNRFEFDNKLWVIDLNTNGVLNNITIKPGRYFSTSFTFKQNTSISITPSDTSITITDATSLFKLSKPIIALSSSYNQATIFYIGVVCGTAPGNYILNFDLTTNKAAFVPLAPIQVIIDNSNNGQISYQTPASVPAAGSIWVGIILSEPNVDPLDIFWTPGDNNKNSITSQISNIKIPALSITSPASATVVSPIRFIFSINDEIATDPQTYKTTNPNGCYTWVLNTITFTISGSAAIIPNTAVLTDKFKVFNTDTDATVASSSIKFTYKGEYAPVYIYCILMCSINIFPPDSYIKDPSTNNLTPSPLLKFYSSFYTNINSQDIIFNELIRGQTYKLRCIIKSTQGDATRRTSSSVSFDNISTTTGTTTTTTIIQPKTITTNSCVDYIFDNEPGPNIKIAIINYCQRLYSANGYFANGCVICTDSQLTYIPAGLSFPVKSTITCITPSTTYLRFLQTTSADIDSDTTTIIGTTTAVGGNVNASDVTPIQPVRFSVCPVPNITCPTDVTLNKKTYADYVAQLVNDLNTKDKFNNILAIANVPFKTVTSRNDSIAAVLSAVTFPVTNIQAAITGDVAFKVTSVNPLICYWQIQSVTTPPTFDVLIACKTGLCGTTKVTSSGVTISTNPAILVPLTPGLTYYIFFGCINDIPFALKRSNVFNSGNFKMDAEPSTPTTTISSSYNNLSLYAILMIFALLF